MDQKSWSRDIAFYIAAGCMVLLFGLVGEVTFYMSFAFFGLYLW